MIVFVQNEVYTSIRNIYVLHLRLYQINKTLNNLTLFMFFVLWLTKPYLSYGLYFM